MLWERFKSMTRNYSNDECITSENLKHIFINLGFFPTKDTIKTVKNKQVVVEDLLLKRIMNILKLPRAIQNSVYAENQDDTVTSRNVKTILAAICNIIPSQNENISMFGEFNDFNTVKFKTATERLDESLSKITKEMNKNSECASNSDSEI